MKLIHSLTRYAQSVNGGLEKANLSIDNDNCCVITEANGNTTVLNPDDFLEWDASSEFISGDLNAPVFSFHIHDGDLWMYTLFANGNAPGEKKKERIVLAIESFANGRKGTSS